MRVHPEPNGRPKPWDYQDYRRYLRDMIVYLKAHQRGFSYRNFARKAGLSSQSFLKLVADGKRNLSLKSIAGFGRALGHNRREQEVFENLVMLGQATNDTDRNLYYRRLRKFAGLSDAQQMTQAQYEVYSRWYVIPIRELMLRDDFSEDGEWIAQQLDPPIRPSEATKALELLEDVGLIERDSKGRLRPVTVKLTSTPGPVGPLAARNYHRSMLELAAQSLDRVAVDERNISSLTVNLTAEQYDQVVQRVEEFRRELLDAIEDGELRSDPSAAKAVYLFSLSLFPLSRRKESES